MQLQRRASESSVMEKDRRPRVDRDRADRSERTESEERRRRERRKEREERHRREKEKTRTGDKKTRKPQGLDLIDKLDVTGIYGQGCTYLHEAVAATALICDSVPPRWSFRRLQPTQEREEGSQGANASIPC